MRALISLYHEAGTFITPGNLSAHIDHAFFEGYNTWQTTTEKRDKSFVDLKRELDARRAMPKLSTDDAAESHLGSGEGTSAFSLPKDTWSDNAPERVRLLKAALYGTEISSDVPVPGYEVLVEEHERVQKLLQEAQEQ